MPETRRPRLAPDAEPIQFLEEWRSRFFTVTWVYLMFVAANAFSLVLLFWLRVANVVDFPWSSLIGYAGGTGGLGAGSLVFSYPLKYLFRQL